MLLRHNADCRYADRRGTFWSVGFTAQWPPSFGPSPLPGYPTLATWTVCGRGHFLGLCGSVHPETGLVHRLQFDPRPERGQTWSQNFCRYQACQMEQHALINANNCWPAVNFCCQVVACVGDMFCNFYLVEIHMTAKKIRRNWDWSVRKYQSFCKFWSNFLYRTCDSSLVEMSSIA